MQISYHDYNYFVCTRVLCGQVHRRYEKKKEKHWPIGPIPAQSSRINYAAAPSEGATLLRIYI